MVDVCGEDARHWRRCPGRDDPVPCYSSVRCVDAGEKTFVGERHEYAFRVYNRSCLYEHVLWRGAASGGFAFHAPPRRGQRGVILPRVTLSSRAWDLPIMKWKADKVRRKMGPYHDWAPDVVHAPLPCPGPPPPAADGGAAGGPPSSGVSVAATATATAPHHAESLAYYSPVVAPWNFAHTLFCDLFGLFWAAWELGHVALDFRVVSVGRHYNQREFPLPGKNVAFRMFTRAHAGTTYDANLPTGVYRRLLVGIGTKTWSWVTPAYAASGSRPLWYAFRRHLVRVVGARERPGVVHPYPDAAHYEAGRPVPPLSVPDVAASDPKRPLRLSVCKKIRFDNGKEKADKRGVLNYDEVEAYLRAHFAASGQHDGVPPIDVHVESAVGKTAQQQVQMMLDSDVFICNEGTLATSFFLMPPGSAFISLPLVVHTPHLHQRPGSPLGRPPEWWRAPDPLRPDPRKNTGGNIDWFPPAIDWVRCWWYDRIPLNETEIVLETLRSLRNYMPDYSLSLRERRLVPLVADAARWIVARRAAASAALLASGTDDGAAVAAAATALLTDRPNYSRNADLCRLLLAKNPSLVISFNTPKCFFGMSWLCEFWSNTALEWRFLHEKWRLSRGHCGDERSSLRHMAIADPRDEAPEAQQRPMAEYLYYTCDQLATSYTTLDFRYKTWPNREQLAVLGPDCASVAEAWDKKRRAEAAGAPAAATAGEAGDDPAAGKEPTDSPPSGSSAA